MRPASGSAAGNARSVRLLGVSPQVAASSADTAGMTYVDRVSDSIAEDVAHLGRRGWQPQVDADR
jgi:hypothetical protein